MASIKISTGLKTYDIEDENGHIRGQISFNPSDMNFFERAQNLKDRVTEILDDVKVKQNEIKEEADVAAYISEVDKQIKQEVNTLFDSPNASDVVFGNQNCLNTLNGETFIERFLIAFTPIIQEAFMEEQKKSDARISKYTKQVK